jgi:hypothetical protein
LILARDRGHDLGGRDACNEEARHDSVGC